MVAQFNHPDLQVVILAAGKGVRMRSVKPKVLHKVLGRGLLEHVLHTVESLAPKGISVVVGFGGKSVREYIGTPRGLDWVEQREQLGTAHAVLQCEKGCENSGHVLIVCGDTPLLSGQTLAMLVAAHNAADASVSVLSVDLDAPGGYGRILRKQDGDFVGIVEEKDADAAQKVIAEISSGIFCVRTADLFKLLHQVESDNAQGEYYLPDIVSLAVSQGLRVQAVKGDDAAEILGVNDRSQLAEAEAVMQWRIIRDWQTNGVSIEQPETVRIEASVSIGVDTVIRAGTQLIGSTHVGDECFIGPYAILMDAWLDDRVEVFSFSHIASASVGAGASVGPFARLRPEAELDEDVHIGNFVEVKKSVIGRGSKVNHLSYVGDTIMGSGCNVGAGTITCNYDGANKHQTVIGDGVFVGSDTKLIAPIKVGNNATIGAGSIISKAVKAGGLTLSARPEQRHMSNWQRPSKKKD
ncbi:MAG: bifunctional UDP-N-acetylglucosamine diphosphorylase/glucosamine-1-phosphate N-acetyltransferase GlmU [Mariprofundaceae bacterium]